MEVHSLSVDVGRENDVRVRKLVLTPLRRVGMFAVVNEYADSRRSHCRVSQCSPNKDISYSRPDVIYLHLDLSNCLLAPARVGGAPSLFRLRYRVPTFLARPQSFRLLIVSGEVQNGFGRDDRSGAAGENRFDTRSGLEQWNGKGLRAPMEVAVSRFGADTEAVIAEHPFQE